MLSVFRFSRGGVLGRVLGVTALAALLFMAGCTSSSSNTPPPPTTPTLSAAVAGLGSVSPGQTGASYTITVSNAAGSAATSGTVTVTDPPTNFTVTAISGTGWTCTLATLTCTRNDPLPAGQSYPPITVTGNVTGAAGQSISVPITISGGGLTTSVTSSPSVSIVKAPSISKAFNPTSIGLNSNSTLTFTITNPSANTVAQTGLAFSDTLPSGMVVATPNGLANTCNGTATAAAGSGSVSLTGGTVAAAGTCTVTVNVTGTTVGVFNNTSGAVSSTNGGTGNTASANLTVVGFPTISKAFGGSSILLNASTSLTFTITNPAANTVPLAGVAFSDALAAGLVVASPNGLTNTCGGTPTATAGSSSVSMTGGAVAVNATCTLSVNVTGTTAGTKTNTTGAISSTQSGTGAVSNTVTLNVIAPPSISKAFGAPGVAVNGSTSLTFTITNPAGNTVALTGVAFTDSLPAGTVVATPNALVNNCGGGVAAVAGSGSVALAGGTVAANANCTITVNVTATAAGNFTNTTGAVSSTNGGTGTTATANLSAAAAPTISKAFGAATIPLSGTTSLTFTITNPAANPALTGVAFSDNLTSGLVVATPNGLTSNCGGTVTATAGSSLVSLTGGNVAVSGTCTIAVNVTGSTAGAKPNTTQAISSTQSGAGAVSNTATLTVIAPPTISKNFGAATVPVNGSTSLTFTVTNPNSTPAADLSGIAFTDTLPTGMSVSTPNGLTGSCGAGTITATAGSNSVSLSGAAVAHSGSCLFSVNVTPTVAGANLNTTGHVTSTEGGTGGTASATLSAIGPPSISKAFGATGVAVNGTTSLTFTITNPNTVALTGVAFTDAMPTGLAVASTPGTNSCSGTVTATAGSGNISLAGGSVAANASCTVVVNVTATQAGSFPNTTGAVSSTNGGTGTTSNTATLNAAAPPTISKSFSPKSVPLNSSSTLSFTLTNPSTASALSGVAFTDTLPGGVKLASTTVTGFCGSGTITAAINNPPGTPSTVSLSGGTLTASPTPGSSCTFSVSVTGISAGAQVNTTGNVTSTQSGTGGTASDTLTVVAPPTMSKSFSPNSVPLNGNSTLSFTVTNPNTASALSGIAFTDTLPGGVKLASTTVTGSCGSGTITATVNNPPGTPSTVSLSGGTLTASPAAGSSCTFSVSVTGISAGAQVNTTSTVSSTEGGTGGTASDTLNVFAPPTISMLSASSGAVGSSLTITGTNFGSTQAQGSSTVTVNGVAATPVSGGWSPASITITVPSGATGTGNVVVTVLGVPTATSSATQFTVVSCTSNCTLSGTIIPGTPGLPVSGVTITITGPAPSSNTTIKTTDSGGNYTAALAPGSYLVTPSLPGYTFSPPAPNVNISSNTTIQNFTETSAQTSYSISGTVSYAGSKTGRVFILVEPSGCTGCGAVAGTSVALTSGSASYTVRGLLPSGAGQNGNGSFTVFAFMDMSTLNTGIQNDSDPSGSDPSTVMITNANVTGANVTLADPNPPPTPLPVTTNNKTISVSAGNGTAVIQYSSPTDSNRVEVATSYNVYFGTDANATNGAGSPKNFKAQGENQNVLILTNGIGGVTLTDGLAYNFKMTALVGSTESAASNIASATMGATTGNFTVSGTVTIPAGTGNGPLYVGVYGGASGHSVYVKRIPTPYTSSVSYSVSGVPNGTYQNFAIIDEDSDGEINVPDLDNVGNHSNTPTIVVNNASVTNANLDLTPENIPSSVSVSTSYQPSCGSGPCYGLNFQVNWGTKRPVAIAMISGPNVPVPFDMSVDEHNSVQSPSFTTAPVVGDAYQFQVLYADGTSGTLSASVTGVLGANDLVTNIGETTSPSPISRTNPLFTWTAPASPPTPTYYYGICVNGPSLNWCDYGHGSSNGIPAPLTSIQYNADGSASSSSLTSGTTYNVNIQVIDANGNSAQASSTYMP